VDIVEHNFEQHATALSEMLATEGIHADPAQVEQLDHYRRLLWSWNERMNLTGHTTLEKFVGRDVVDSFQLAKLLKKNERVLDVGTGGGVPGIPLAILRPDLKVSLCESTAKKATAVDAIVSDLGLMTPVYACRAEEVLQITTFDTLVARAIATTSKVLFWLAPYWDAFNQLLLVKGPSWVDERAEARHQGRLHGLELRKAAVYRSPGTGAESVVLKLWRSKKGRQYV
jgi:16S rRNA (guanine527-N7)-methyltransferase